MTAGALVVAACTGGEKGSTQPPTANQLTFAVQPSNTDAGAAIMPAVQVAAQDGSGKVATAFTGTVTVTIGANPSGGVLSGTTTVAAVAGVATLCNLTLDKIGTGYTLSAAAGGLTGTTSAPFNVTAPATGHVIAIRAAGGRGELFDQRSGRTFVARGNNYTRLDSLQNIYGGTSFDHSTFIPGHYDPNRIELALAGMCGLQYNVVRVWLNGTSVGGLANPAGGLSSPYVANVADFIKRAKAHGIFVVLTLEFIPEGSPYSDLLNAQQGPLFQQINLYFLTAGGVSAVSLFWTDFINALAAAGAPIDAILAYQLHEEAYFDGSAPPLSLTGGTVTTVNGQSYDMADSAAKRRMMDENLIYYVGHVRAAILAVDPTALVTVGFFWPQGPNPARIGDTRLSNPYPAIAGSTIDFVNLSVYPEVDGLTLAQLAQNFAFASYLQKPVVMGEFGANKAYHASEQDAAQVLTTWEVQSCGYGFSGWLLWTWDTSEQPEWWNARSGSGLIGDYLSPARRPDPCIK